MFVDSLNGLTHVDESVDATLLHGQIEQLLPQQGGQLKLEIMLEGALVVAVIALLAQANQLTEHSIQRQSLQ